MKARLYLLDSSSLNHDIILLDKVMGVGDISLGNKCYKALSSMKERGRFHTRDA
jgi:ABC-type polysaccharide/polyol phosphate transport system ATPase subunit